MADLAAALAMTPAPRWVVGTVASLQADTVTLTVDGGTVTGVGYLDQYAPVVGDVVHALAGPRGLLVLGSNNTPPAGPPVLPTPDLPVTVGANATSTYQRSTGGWAAGALLQAPDVVATFLYPVMSTIATLTGIRLARLTMALTRVGGGPPELALHSLASLAGVLPPPTDPLYGVDQPVTGTTGTINLPLEWGYRLISGAARGITIGGGLYTGDWSGSSGLLTFYPL